MLQSNDSIMNKYTMYDEVKNKWTWLFTTIKKDQKIRSCNKYKVPHINKDMLYKERRL